MTIGNSESESDTLARLLAGGALRKRRTRRLLLARLLKEEREADDEGDEIEDDDDDRSVVRMLVASGLLRKRRRRKKAKSAQVTGKPELGGATAGSTPAMSSAEPPGQLSETQTKLLADAEERVTQTAKIELLVESLRKDIATDPALAASVLRTWLEEVAK